MAVHHIGSTALPGLLSKPKIDILVVVRNPGTSIDVLEAIGLEYCGEYNIPLHYGFRKRATVSLNVHVYPEGHPEIELNLLFRNTLRENPHVRQAYGCMKEELLQDKTAFERSPTGFVHYTLRKGDFIREVLRQAGFTRLRILKCNDETEWQAAKHLRNTYFFGPHGIEDPYTWTFNHKSHVHFVLYQGTEIIGYTHIQLWPAQRAAMRIIVIEEPHRHKGLGGQFLALCEQWLQAQGYQSLHVESSPKAVAFYRKYGYVNMPFDDPDGHEGGPEDVAMGKIFR